MASVVTYSTSAERLTALSLSGGFFDGWGTPPTPDEHLEVPAASARVSLAMDGP